MSGPVYKILTAEQWQSMQAMGRFEGSADDERDGFIHLSAKEQVAGTLARHFAGKPDLMLLTVDADAVGAAIAVIDVECRHGRSPPGAAGDVAISAPVVAATHAVIRSTNTDVSNSWARATQAAARRRRKARSA